MYTLEIKSYNLKKNKIVLIFYLLIIGIASCDQKDEQIETRKIVGVVQKGPFVKGSDVRIHELNADLTANGKVFYTKSLTDFGDFEFLESESTSFIYLTATGLYFNEVKGDISQAMIST
jgi:uncharacterized protein YtpQ (UPF0354 family)